MNKNVVQDRLLEKSTPFAIREAFNHLRTNLMYTIKPDEGSPIYSVCSADEGVGKSTIIANLAVSYSMIGKKVLLIDGDMRAPALSRIFKTDKRHVGLSELLSHVSKDDSAAIQHLSIENLDLLSSGRIPSNPSELLSSDTFTEYLQKWRYQYDIIFIDFPPIGIVTDAVLIAKSVTGYLFIVRSGISDYKEVNAALEAMDSVNARVLGVILNDVSLKGISGGYRRYGRYGKYGKYGRYGKYSKYSKYSKYNGYGTNKYATSYNSSMVEQAKRSNAPKNNDNNQST